MRICTYWSSLLHIIIILLPSTFCCSPIHSLSFTHSFSLVHFLPSFLSHFLKNAIKPAYNNYNITTTITHHHYYSAHHVICTFWKLNNEYWLLKKHTTTITQPVKILRRIKWRGTLPLSLTYASIFFVLSYHHRHFVRIMHRLDA